MRLPAEEPLQYVLGNDEAGIASCTVLAANGANDCAALVRTMLVLRRHLGDEPLHSVRATVDEKLESYAAMLVSLESLSELEVRLLREELARHLLQLPEVVADPTSRGPD